MPKKTRKEKQESIQEQIKELQRKHREIEKQKHQDIGKYFCNVLRVEDDREAFELIDKISVVIDLEDDREVFEFVDKIKSILKDNSVQVSTNEVQ